MLPAEVFYGIACCHSLSRFRDSFHSSVFMATMCGSLYRAWQSIAHLCYWFIIPPTLFSYKWSVGTLARRFCHWWKHTTTDQR